jgi:peptidoglycan/xylan/chitin deacetylase (PgdA/CDA1 family)
MQIRAILVFMLALIASNAASAMTWPNNAKSAVSISADDGWPSQLQQAQILQNYNFRGSFYLTPGGLPSVVTNATQWRQVFQMGHEVGSHSYSHWSPQTLEGKTWQQVATDVGTNEAWLLNNIYSGVPTDHTYSYPYGNYILGPGAAPGAGYQSRQVGACEYVALLSAVVTGAREAGSGENAPADVTRRRFFISALPIYGSDATAFAQAKAAIDNGITKGTWTVLVFHSLGDPGDGYSVSTTAYTQIINYIASKQSELWVAPVVSVKNHIAANTPAAQWTCTLP